MPKRSKATKRARKATTKQAAKARSDAAKRAAKTRARNRRAAAREEARRAKAKAPPVPVVETGDPPAPPEVVSPEEARGMEPYFGTGIEEAEASLPGTVHCPNCRQLRPAAEFVDQSVSWDPRGVVATCTTCRENGTPHVRVALGLDPRLVAMVRARFRGATYRQIGDAFHLSERTVEALLTGVKGPLARGAGRKILRSMFEAMGLGPEGIAGEIARLLQAKKAIVYKGEVMREELEDHATQVATLRILTQLADLHPPKQQQVESRGVLVVTNLDDVHPESRSGVIEAHVLSQEESA